MLEQQKESKRIVRFEKTSLCLNYDAEREFSITIYDEEFDPGSG